MPQSDMFDPMKGSAEFYDRIHTRLKDYEQEAGIVRQSIDRYCSTKTVARTLLDVGCGTGLHAEHFARFLSVIGVDSSPSMLAHARRRLPGADFYECDMRALDLPERFDAVVCLFAAIGTMPDVVALRLAITRMGAHLKPGGVLIVEPWVTSEAWSGDRVRTDLMEDAGIARVVRLWRRGEVSVLEMHHFLDWPSAPRYLLARHELRLFAIEDYVSAIQACGLVAHHDEVGLTGRGLFIGASR